VIRIFIKYIYLVIAFSKYSWEFRIEFSIDFIHPKYFCFNHSLHSCNFSTCRIQNVLLFNSIFFESCNYLSSYMIFSLIIFLTFFFHTLENCSFHFCYNQKSNFFSRYFKIKFPIYFVNLKVNFYKFEKNDDYWLWKVEGLCLLQ